MLSLKDFQRPKQNKKKAIIIRSQITNTFGTGFDRFWELFLVLTYRLTGQLNGWFAMWAISSQDSVNFTVFLHRASSGVSAHFTSAQLSSALSNYNQHQRVIKACEKVPIRSNSLLLKSIQNWTLKILVNLLCQDWASYVWSPVREGFLIYAFKMFLFVLNSSFWALNVHRVKGQPLNWFSFLLTDHPAGWMFICLLAHWWSVFTVLHVFFVQLCVQTPTGGSTHLTRIQTTISVSERKDCPLQKQDVSRHGVYTVMWSCSAPP